MVAPGDLAFYAQTVGKAVTPRALDKRRLTGGDLVDLLTGGIQHGILGEFNISHAVPTGAEIDIPSLSVARRCGTCQGENGYSRQRQCSSFLENPRVNYRRTGEPRERVREVENALWRMATSNVHRRQPPNGPPSGIPAGLWLLCNNG